MRKTGDPDLTAALDGITPDEYGPFLGFVGQVHQYAGDRVMLAGVRSLVEESGALGEPRRAYLLRRIDKLLEAG